MERCHGRAVWLLVLLLAALAPPLAEAAREISPKRECSICHVMWLDDFQREGIKTLIPYDPKPVVASGKQDVVSTERMCFSCHDGFVRDSRFAWAKREHFHPVGITPPPDITIPTVDGKVLFPLNEEGKIYCGTCHSAHGVDWTEEYSPLFLRVKNVDSSLCLACHMERSTGPKGGNHPVFRRLEHKPKALVDGGSKFGQDGDVVCQSCHRIHGAADKKLLVVKNDRSQLCGTCHGERYASDRAEAAIKSTHPVNVQPQHATVPEALLAQGAKLAGGGEVICQTCHRPHFAKTESKILVTANDDAALCKSCHQKQRIVDGGKHDMTLTDAGLKNVRGQAVGQAGSCSACHVPHEGKGPKMAARELAQADEAVAGLCLSCHSAKGPAHEKQVGVHTHPVGRDLSRLPEPPKHLPGFSHEGVKRTDGSGRVSCASCHDPHQWDPNNPDADAAPGHAGNGSNRFLRQVNDTKGGLCASCHRDKMQVADSPHGREAMVKQVPARAQQLPGESVCESCHRVHNGNGPRMWALKPAAGVDPVASTCLSCHQDSGVAKDKTIGRYTHPVNVPASRLGIIARMDGWVAEVKNLFERGKLLPLPLFNEVGMRVAGDGNVTCATCHDPHRHAPPGAAKGTSRFLRLPNDREGTLCRNCHVDKGMVALSKHNLARTAPDEKNIWGVPAKEGSVCGNCHVPHNAGGPKLWAAFTGTGEDGIAQMCRGCHQDGGAAERKQTGQHSHPLRADVKSMALEVDLPLFLFEGERDMLDGRVTCATCHNPHQWDPADPRSEAGAKAKVEGSAANSFLRLSAAPHSDLCIHCHTDKRWIRGTDHDLNVTAPAESNIQGSTVTESGICGQCHLVHNAVMPQRLWARTPGQGFNPVEQMCRSCHAADKVAAEKVPTKLQHPPDVQAVSVPGWPRSGQRLGYFPVFDAEGKPARSGVISCPTCHNAHQWMTGMDREGPGRNLEGNVQNSFLRNKSDFGLCTNCHGMDALFRYKYFHGETSRVPHNLYR